RADADDAPGEHLGGRVQRFVDADRFELAVAGAEERSADPRRRGDEAVAVAAAVADEIAVHVAVEAIHDAPQAAVAFLRRDVAAVAAMHADRRRALQIPLADVMLRERLVGEHARRADLGEIAAPFAFEDAVLVTAEVDV